MNNKNCQTSFAIVEPNQVTDDNNSQNKNNITNKTKIYHNSLSFKSEENSLCTKTNFNKKTSINFYNNNFLLNYGIKQIKYQKNNYNTNYSKENKNNIKKRFKNINNSNNNHLKSSDSKINKNSQNDLYIPERKTVTPVFTNKAINMCNNNEYMKYILTDKNQKNYSLEKLNEINSYFFKNLKNENNVNKLNFLYINTDFLKNKENNLLGKSNSKFTGKSVQNYHIKNNVFLPNLSERMKSKLPRYERQLNGFILG